MARHAEVKEKEIIEAGLAIEQTGKVPNPGAIRAKLGFKGGLVRIRSIWEKHMAERDGGSAIDKETGISFDDLPTELAEAAFALIDRQKHHLENTVLHAYLRCQSIFEKRLDEHIGKHELRMKYYKEYELNADESIQKLEHTVNELRSQSIDLNDQLRKFIVDNSQLKGSLAAYEKLLPKASLKPASRTTGGTAK